MTTESVVESVNTAGHLMIGGCDALDLVQEFQTPLVVYDIEQVRQQVRAFRQAFEEQQVNYVVSYASKAFATQAIYQVMNQEKAHIDVVSGGELYTAIQAGFPMAHVSFHGNNKSRSELELAVQEQVGVIILDNFDELDLLSSILERTEQKIAVMLRITPDITAHTHEYIQTGQADSKFGFDLPSGQAEAALKQILENPHLDFRGIHAHIGSQILAVTGFELLAHKLVELAAQWQQKFQCPIPVLNFGGGFGIRYTAEDHPLAPAKFISALVQTVKTDCQQQQLPLPEIWIEPGRSLVGPAGYNLYTVGSSKRVPGLKPYVTVDGGMGDNIRPALYQAEYTAVLAANPQAPAEETIRLAGRYCESGDILISELEFPRVHQGQIVALLATGAYGYAMASNYNRVPRPAVVFAEQGKAQVVVERESYADLNRLDRAYQNK
ncbi:diaminopimelate decarboxylase [Lactobacillus sp. DCY120]|uniref:Diaminopimelate decarboxylase n=1 Tax=Bombilactobacillus apium TaxID=2675299 RepID=A0A850QV14_9LACO|nr:diaminopimelate decarboxylase [Bombilactobacillus apium]NVY95614.1 diaminopimelate decarboxylase [Bombilactobacillus apium]